MGIDMPTILHYVQSLASAILAPSLTLVADSLSLEWRKQLTKRVHQKYLKGTTFYSVSHLADMQVAPPLNFSSRHPLLKLWAM